MISGGAVAERVARESYGRLVAILAAPTGDLELAEDALSAAFEQALGTWPDTGVPDNPEGWLLTVARNRQRDIWKSAAHRSSAPLDDATDVGRHATSPIDDLDPDAIPDRRLELLFVCAHPAIDPAIRTPLMLQVVLGFEATQIARAFAMAPAAMGQRLVRAKRRIKDARIRFGVPDRTAMPERLPPVLEAVYGCYAIDRPARSGPMARPDSLAGEAHYLAVTLATLLGDEPAAWGLAALITLSLSRLPAQDGPYVPLDEQDPADWDTALVTEGEAYLRRAAHPGQPGRFELEAAIQAVHCARARTGSTDWAAIHTLSTALLSVAPSLGGSVAHAAVLARLDGPTAGLRQLEPLSEDAAGFQPYWAVRAALLAEIGETGSAATAFERASALAEDPAVRAYLAARRRALD